VFADATSGIAGGAGFAQWWQEAENRSPLLFEP
jgi:hypothetical protein